MQFRQSNFTPRPHLPFHWASAPNDQLPQEPPPPSPYPEPNPVPVELPPPEPIPGDQPPPITAACAFTQA